MNTALVGIGNDRWIAGVQYHHSLLFGNSLLPPDEQLALRVYLEEDVHRTTDYTTVRGLAQGIWSTDFFPEAARPLSRKLRKVARIIVRERRIPQFPRSSLPQLVRDHKTEVLFTANGLESAIKVPQVCWIPDFQHHHHPEFFDREELERRETAFDQVFSDAAAIIVSNQSSFDDAMRRYPGTGARLFKLPFVMCLGDKWRSGDPAAVAGRLGLPRKFLLFPAQFWRHKNHAHLFEAVRQARARDDCTDLVLVCTGHPEDARDPAHGPSLREMLHRHELEGEIRILGLIPRQDQVQLMRAAAAIVQPSLFEGWSALVEECRSLGKTVLASDIPMHREQEFEGVHFFDPEKPESIAARIAEVWPGLRPGPNAAREANAASAHLGRIKEFGRSFGEICRSVAERA